MKLRELFSNELNEAVYPGMLWSMERMQMPGYPEFYDKYEKLKKEGRDKEAQRVFEEFAFWVNARHEQKKNPRIKLLFDKYENIREKEQETGNEYPKARYRVIYAYYKIKLGPLGNTDENGVPNEEKIKRGKEDLARLEINPNKIENELINEVHLQRKPQRKSVKDSMPGMSSYDYLDNNNHPYLAYRFGIALAAAPDNETMYPRSPMGSDFTLVDYTEADAEIRKGAEKFLGLDPPRSTGPGSKEVPTTNTKSPVAKTKRNQYGV